MTAAALPRPSAGARPALVPGGNPPGLETARFGMRLTGKAWVAIAVVALHVLVFAFLIAQRHIAQKAQPPEALVLLEIPAAPPPPRDTPEVVIETPPVVIPPPVIQIEDRPQTITAVVVENPPPPQPAVTAAPAVEGPPAPAAPRPPSLVSGIDLSANMVEAVPPRYPYESRRLKEEGMVVLDLTLGTDGRVARIGVRTSSGFPRLDNAAMDAVRRWRWSPTTRDGMAVGVRGLVEIPFILSGHGDRGKHRRGGPPREELPRTVTTA